MRIFFGLTPLKPCRVFGTITLFWRFLSLMPAFGLFLGGDGFPGFGFTGLGVDLERDLFLDWPPGVGSKWKTTSGLVYKA